MLRDFKNITCVFLLGLSFSGLFSMSGEQFEDILNKAEDGNAYAQYEVGCCYSWGEWITGRNLVKAFEWFHKAANQNHTEALSELGDCYRWGKGVEMDLAKSILCYSKASKKGDAHAKHCLSYLEMKHRKEHWYYSIVDTISDAECKTLFLANVLLVYPSYFWNPKPEMPSLCNEGLEEPDVEIQEDTKRAAEETGNIAEYSLSEEDFFPPYD